MKPKESINNKLTAVINLSADERYSYFIRKIADMGEVWGLYDNGWALLGINENGVLAFWPEIEFAELCAVDTWKNYIPKKIYLEDFTEKWLKEMKNDNKEAAIFYTPKQKGIIVSAQHLFEDLNKELSQYQ